MAGGRSTGVTRGTIVAGRRARPPLPLPTVEVRLPSQISSVGRNVDEVVRGMLLAYKTVGQGQYMASLTRMAAGRWWGLIREMAAQLIDEGLSPEYYVRFVCKQAGQLRGRFPYPAEVFSLKSMGGWIRQYRASWSIPIPTYLATDDRRRQHLEAVLARLRAD